MKHSRFSKGLLAGIAALSLLSSQTALSQREHRVPVELLKPSISARMLPMVAAETSAETCFDMSGLGDADKIRCVDYVVKYDNETGYYEWDAAKSSTTHPRQQLVTSGYDELVTTLSKTPSTGSSAICLATDAYAATTDMAKGALAMFYYTVDADNPIVKLNYAAVIENGKHAIAGTTGFEQYAQPWIWIYAYYWDKNNDPQILECIDITHYPNKSATISGWKSVTKDSRNVAAVWKDWSTLTWDMSKYAGQKIGIAVEVHDCAEKAYDTSTEQITLCPSHELARVYCYMECASSTIEQACNGDKVTLTAPAGFNKYKWYKTTQTSTSLGTTQSIDVSATETANYTCEMTSDNSCGTSKYTTQVYTNTYTFSKTIAYEDIPYDFHGQKLTTSGTYKDTLIGQNYLGCDSIEILNLTVNVPQIITQECNGDSIILTAPAGYTSYQWMNAYKENIPGATKQKYALKLGNDENARYICHMEDGKGSVVELDTVVYSNRHAFTKVIQEGESYDFYGEKLSIGGTYTKTVPGKTSYLGCDSVEILNLVVKKAGKDGCFDMTDIEGGNVDLYNVDFGDMGGGYVGWLDPETAPYNHPRHTMMVAAGTDALIPQLSVLPPNEQTSFRLASDAYQTGVKNAKGADLVFSYKVEKDNPIVVIQYACVIEDPNSTASKAYQAEANPWVELILKVGTAEGSIVQHNPYNASSVTGTGWKTVTSDAAGNKAYWKDWSTISIDLSSRVGQTIQIVLKQRDCAVESVTQTMVNLCGKHKSHLYAYLGCAPMAITQTCDNNGVTLTAPDGCTYQWYKGGTKLTGETKQTLIVNYPNSDAKVEYTCQLGGIITATNPLILKSTVYSNTHTFSKTIAHKDIPYDFHGQKLTTSGTYKDTLVGGNYLGCDSIEILNLTVEKCEGYTVTYNRTIPQGVTFDFYGQMLTKGGSYSKTFQTEGGCDSTINLNLTIQGPAPQPVGDECFDMSTFDNVNSICMDFDMQKTGTEGETEKFAWIATRNPAGHPREAYRTTEGLDDLCAELSLLPPNESSSVRFESNKYTTTDLGKGEAAIYMYDIDAGHPFFTIQYAGVLETPGHAIATKSLFKEFAQPYIRLYWAVDGTIIKSIEHFPSDAASVAGWTKFTDRRGYAAIWKDWESIQLDMTQYIGHKLQIAIEAYDCAEEDFDTQTQQIIFCKKHHQAHAYLHVSCERALCAGTAKMKKDSICADASNMTIVLNYTEGTPTKYELAYNEAAKAAGFVNTTSAVDLQGSNEIVIALKHENNPQMISGRGYQKPGQYEVTVTEHTICGNKLTHTLPFTLLYPASIITQRWNDVLALNNENFNGGYTFSKIRWFNEVEGEILGNVNRNSYIYTGPTNELLMGKGYWAELTRSTDGNTTCTCRYIPSRNQDPQPSFGAGRINISRRSNSSRTIDLETNLSGRYYAYDVQGKLMQTGMFGEEYNAMSIDLNNAKGNVVVLLFRSNDGTQETKKIVIQ